MLEEIKKYLRISNTAYDAEITDLINAAKADLRLSGVINIDETDALIKRAVSTYVKANFGWNNPDVDKLQNSYNLLKGHLTFSAEYTEVEDAIS